MEHCRTGRGFQPQLNLELKIYQHLKGTVRKQTGSVTIPKSSLEISSIGAVLEDFDFDITLKTVSFKFKVPGQPTISINGSRLDARAKSALRRAKAGQSVQIFDIKVVNPKNPSYKFKNLTCNLSVG